MERWGLLAGRGLLPLEVAKGMKQLKIEPFVLGLVEEIWPALEEAGFVVHKESLGNLSAVRRFFQEKKVTRMIVAGKAGKEALFTGPEPDEDLKSLLDGLPVKNDDAIMLALVEYFAKYGVKVEKQTKFLTHLFSEVGCLTTRIPTAREKQDIQFGWRMAKGIGGLDIGQSVVVKNGAVLAVEAIEGTDEAILRGGRLGGKGTVVVKVAKPMQDYRFDVPTIGPDTIEMMIKSGAAVLAVEAGTTFILEKEKTVARADDHGISLVVVDKNSCVDS